MKLDALAVQLAIEAGDWTTAIQTILRHNGIDADVSKFVIQHVDWSSPSYCVKIEMASGSIYSFFNGRLYKGIGYRNSDQTRVGLLGVINIYCPHSIHLHGDLE